MAQTERISWTSGAPSTEFNLGADIVAQSQSGNYSVVRISAQAINRGSTGSFSSYDGRHRCAIDGEGLVDRTGTLASGYGTGAERWDVSKDIQITHDSEGNHGAVTLRQTVSGWFSNEKTASLSGFPRIPKVPSKPGTPTASEILPTSMRLSWSAATDNNGSSIDGYLLRRWDNPEGTGTYYSHFANDRSRVISGLTPGKEYRWAVYAHNDVGYSAMSGARVARTLSGMWYKVSGVWKRVVPFVKVNGVWKTASVFIKDAGVWKRGG